MSDEDHQPGENTSIAVFGRLRPSKAAEQNLKRGAMSIYENGHGLAFHLERMPDGYVDHSRLNYDFKFNGFLDQTVTQSDVFRAVAQPVIENCLLGFNGTIFACNLLQHSSIVVC